MSGQAIRKGYKAMKLLSKEKDSLNLDCGWLTECVNGALGDIHAYYVWKLGKE